MQKLYILVTILMILENSLYFSFVESVFIPSTQLFHFITQNTTVFPDIVAYIVMPARVECIRKFGICESMLAQKDIVR